MILYNVLKHILLYMFKSFNIRGGEIYTAVKVIFRNCSPNIETMTLMLLFFFSSLGLVASFSFVS